jgi:predicted DNA-binding protein
MPTQNSKAFATRLPADEAERIEAAVEQTEQTKSAFIKRAVRYYVIKNPDDIAVLYPKHSIHRLLAGGNDA